MGKTLVIIALVIILIIAIVAAALLIPLNSGKSAGVVFRQTDQEAFEQKSGINTPEAQKATLLDLITGNYVGGDMVSVNAFFTSAEFTAYLNNYFAPTPGIENVQIKFGNNRKIVLSCKATEEAIKLFGDAPEYDSLKSYLWLAKGKTLRVEETVTSVGGTITTKLDKVYVGQIDITGFVPVGALPIGTALNNLFRVENSADFSISEAGLSINGAMLDMIAKK